MRVKGSRVTDRGHPCSTVYNNAFSYWFYSTIPLHSRIPFRLSQILSEQKRCPTCQSFGSARRRGIQWSTGGVSFMASGDCPSVRRRLCARLQQLGDSSNANVSSHLCLEGGTEMINFDVTTKTSVNSLRRGSKRTGHVTSFYMRKKIRYKINTHHVISVQSLESLFSIRLK